MLFLFSFLLIHFLKLFCNQSIPKHKALSSERLKQIDANINQWIKEGQLNGATAIILRNGKIVYHKAFGFASENVPMKTDNIFRIASMTKAYHQRGCHDAV